ncbi:MAG: M1 family aminopeptidase [Planctomycetota bacterium]
MHRLLFPLSLFAPTLLFVDLAAAEEVAVCRYCEGAHADHWRAAAAEDADGQTSGKYAPDRLVDVLWIKIDVTPDFEEQTLQASTTVTFTPISKPVGQLRLNAVRLRVAEVTASRKIAEYVSTDEDLTILFAEPIPVGQQASVTVRYTAEPKKGLYFRTEKMGYPAGDDHIWTQGETHEAPHWFPCVDYPNERSSTEVICRVKPDMTVLSNGRVVSESVDAATGLKAVHWVQEKPHVSYLVCLVAGYFEKLEKAHGDLRLRFFSQPSLAEHAANAFADTDQIMAFYEEEIGVKFPWDKYDQVTIRDFNSGGMENTTLTTLTHRTIFSGETENIYSSRGLDAHETAHQWFGDYVTCEDWANLWLNEGFATYYTHLYKGHRLGHDEMLYGLYRDAAGRILNRGDDTRPIVWRGYTDPWQQFDYRAYPKGSWVLHMLRSQLGKDVYRRAIKSYLQKHALTSVSTPDLLAELEDASGNSLDRFFDQWVYHGGAPRLKVSHKWLPKEKLAHVRVEQTQKVSDEVMMFHLPAVVRFHSAGETVDHAVEITGAAHDFYVPLEKKPDLVRFDPEYTILAKVDFAKPQAMFERQLELDNDVIGRVLAAEALGRKDNKKSVAALAGALNGDPFYGVRIAASKALAKLGTDGALAALRRSVAQDDARVRQQVVKDIARFYRPEMVDLLLSIAQEEPNPAVAAAAIRGLGKFAAEKVAPVVARGMTADSLRDEVPLAALRAAADLQDASLRDQVLETLRTRRIDFGARTYAGSLAAVAKLYKHADDRTPALDFLRNSLTDPGRRVRQAAVEALGELGDVRAVPLLSDLADGGNDRVGEAAKKAIDQINDQAVAAPKEVRELRTLVRELQKDQKRLERTVDELRAKSVAK